MSDKRDMHSAVYVPARTGTEDGPRWEPSFGVPVTVATNAPAPPAVVALAFAVVLVLAAIVGFAGVALLRLDARMAFVVAVALAIAGCLYVLNVVSGDRTAGWEIKSRRKVLEKWLRVDYNIRVGEHDERVQAETNRHIEEMTRIESQTINRETRERLAWSEDTIHAMQRKLLAVDSIAPPKATFVQAKPDAAAAAVDAWVDTLWLSDGTPTFKNGKTPLPWTNRWRGESWCDDAKRIVLEAGIVVPNASGTFYPIVVKSKRDARSLLRIHLR